MARTPPPLIPAMLRAVFYTMKRDAAPGVDSMIWETYERDLDRRIEGQPKQLRPPMPICLRRGGEINASLDGCE